MSKVPNSHMTRLKFKELAAKFEKDLIA